MGAKRFQKAMGVGLLLAALLAGMASCSLHVHPLPGVSVEIPAPMTEGVGRHD